MRGRLVDQTHIIKDLEVAKRILSNLNNTIDGMMRIHIGQAISEAINTLKTMEEHNENN